MNQTQVLASLASLQLPLGEYIVMGGSSLAIRGIRETKDLDILVTPKLYKELAANWPEDLEYFRKWNRHRLKQGEFELYPDFYLEKANQFQDVQMLITEADMVNSIPIQKLEHLINAKLDNSREKDLQDVALMRAYLKTVFQGTIIAASVRDSSWLKTVQTDEVITADTWQLHSVRIAYQQIEHLQKQLLPGWYAHFWTAEQIIVVFPEHIFAFDHTPENPLRAQAITYGTTQGIPLEQLDFKLKS